jgi:hypothetical protein
MVAFFWKKSADAGSSKKVKEKMAFRYYGPEKKCRCK